MLQSDGSLSQHRPSGAGEDRNGDLGVPVLALGGYPAPALRGRRGSQPEGWERDHLCRNRQHRPSGAGEDRNTVLAILEARDRASQHRPSGAGEDRNAETLRRCIRDLGQHRLSGAGEDRNNESGKPNEPPACASTGPPGPARIATGMRYSMAGAGTPAPQHRPSGAGEDRNIASFRHVTTLLRQHRPSGAGEDRNGVAEALGYRLAGVQHRPSGAGEDRNPQLTWWMPGELGASTGPPGPARIATLAERPVEDPGGAASTGPPGPARIATRRPPASRMSARDQHRPSGAGEDRNYGEDGKESGMPPAQHRPSGAGEDRNSQVARGAAIGADAQHRPSGAGEDRNYAYERFMRSLLGQHRPSGAGEDRNIGSAEMAIQGIRRQHRPSGSARIATSAPSVPKPRPAPPAPALRGRRGSQQLRVVPGQDRRGHQHRPSGAGEDRNL